MFTRYDANPANTVHWLCLGFSPSSIHFSCRLHRETINIANQGVLRPRDLTSVKVYKKLLNIRASLARDLNRG